ncbi:MAG: VOC family protein [Parvibaculaceae bacterium]
MTESPVIKVWDVAFPRLQAPDLDTMEAFLLDFGMVRALRTTNTLYMRGVGPAPYLHVTHLGDPGFRGFAFQAASREDLDKLAETEPFSPVEKLESPGGGWRTWARDPMGLQVEVVYGIELSDSLSNSSPRKLNMASDFQRIGSPQRIGSGPSRIKRFGHLQLNVADPQKSFEWYRQYFGILKSDTICITPEHPVGHFCRCDRGDVPTDHHSILFTSNAAAGGVSGLNHVSWEVCDFDDVLAGHEFLAAKKRTAEWGVGRHLLGSQIFDYWSDPWGHIHEHWTDGDQFSADVPPGVHALNEAAASQWGPDVPQRYRRTSGKIVS